MVKCTFCGETLNPGTGKMFIKKDATILYFCSMKCEKNMIKLGRTAITTKWSSRYKQ